MPKKIRLDVALLEAGLAADEREAKGLILSGKVKLNGQLCDKPGTMVLPDAEITTLEQKKYVSRGGLKLEAALAEFEINPSNKICADAGCSTGGFTEVLLKFGAKKIFAIDTAYGELDWNLRESPNVEVMERCNVLELSKLPELVDLLTVDLSLLSSKLILPVIKNWLKETGEIVFLLKPQYELDSDKVPEGGIIKDTEIHKKVLLDFLEISAKNSLFPFNIIKSPIKGGQGNTEFLIGIKKQAVQFDAEKLIEQVLLNE